MQTRSATWFLIGFVTVVVSGCAVPVTKQDITPTFSVRAPKQLGLSVVEKRRYVVSGDKDAKFEGLTRSTVGIPWTIDRPNRPENETFADFLANMLKDSFTDAGSEVLIWKMPVGANMDEVVARMPKTGVDKSLVVLMYESKFDQGGGFRMSYNYVHDFHLLVINKDGAVVADKRFSGSVENPLSDKYTMWDMYHVNYKKHLDQFLADETIKSAIGSR